MFGCKNVAIFAPTIGRLDQPPFCVCLHVRACVRTRICTLLALPYSAHTVQAYLVPIDPHCSFQSVAPGDVAQEPADTSKHACMTLQHQYRVHNSLTEQLTTSQGIVHAMMLWSGGGGVTS